MTMKIIPYEAQAHEQLVEIWLQAVRATHHFLTEEDIQFFHGMVRDEALTSVEVWMAVDEAGKLTGFIGLDGPKVEMLFVDPKIHGQGIGKRLLNQAISLKGDKLEVDVNEQNPGACAFYTKFGFVQQGRSELDPSGKPFPILHMGL
ncbi:GNAT family N-acetyltransferase [Paenibacillus sp. NPDC057934]|uniref:GNAT family N-acetyltransferase n=1 Tax=Paenibacillus sp. NPDC057934 TaxID=3346282 RepID=UPI0036DD313C